MERNPLQEDLAANHTGFCEEEALFIADSSHALNIPAGECLQSLSDHFSHQVARTPQNLHNHIRRIHLYLQARCGKCVAGALQDLFIALGEKGFTLRQRMLNVASPLLPERLRMVFEDYMESGMTPKVPGKLSTLSLLHSGIRNDELPGSITGQGGRLDPIDRATVLLKSDDPRQAIHLLIESIHAEPWREDLQNCLLAIFREYGDEGSFTSTYLFLSASNSPYLEKWEALQARFEGRLNHESA